MKLLIIETGGTISGCVSEYDEISEMSSIYSEDVNVLQYICKVLKYAPEKDVVSKVVCYKDSRDIDDKDRNEIVNTIRKYPNIDKILITHGTYTMPETGKYILDNLSAEELENKSIILTGAIYAWIIDKSDAPANIGASLQALSFGKECNGVHICMHQKLFDPRKVKKDTKNLIFVENQ